MDDINYDKWNEVKKTINKQEMIESFFFKEREVWWCSLGLNIGIESNGKNDVFERPVLIIKVFNKNMIWCLPITSTIKELSFYYQIKFNDENRSIITTQIRTISSKRLLRKVDIVGEIDFKNIIEIVINYLKSETPTNYKQLSGGISEPEGDNKTSIA